MLQLKSSFTAASGKEIVYSKWFVNQKQNPSAVVMLVHGMSEHSLRYSEFASFLCKQNIVMYAHDHPGHGRSAPGKAIKGHFADINGWTECVETTFSMYEIVKRENPDIPFFIFGHSMGSLVVRSMLNRYKIEANGVILSGTTNPTKVLVKLGYTLSSFLVSQKGPRYVSKLLNKIGFTNFNRKFPKGDNAPFNWLSRDPEKVKDYIDDPLSGFYCTSGFYKDLFTGLTEVTGKIPLQNLPKNIPIYVFAGHNDPVGGFGKQVMKFHSVLRKNGFINAKLRLYSDARHEMLNETNREEVMTDIGQWLQDVIQGNQ